MPDEFASEACVARSPDASSKSSDTCSVTLSRAIRLSSDDVKWLRTSASSICRSGVVPLATSAHSESDSPEPVHASVDLQCCWRTSASTLRLHPALNIGPRAERTGRNAWSTKLTFGSPKQPVKHVDRGSRQATTRERGSPSPSRATKKVVAPSAANGLRTACSRPIPYASALTTAAHSAGATLFG